MSKLTRALTFTLTVTSLSLIVFPVSAQLKRLDDGGDVGAELGLATGSLEEAVVTIINRGLVLVSLVALIALIYGGVTYIIYLGDDDRIKTAKNVILYAIIGLIVIGLAAVTVNFTIGLFAGRGGPAGA